ncbi:MAG: hypothetical protein ABIR11_11495, partial [Candidatus Limnocylindrales bacterium]
MIRPRAALRHLRRLVPGALTAILVAGLLPAPAPAVASERIAVGSADVASATTDTPAGDPAGQHPSIAYEEAMAHADDVIGFTPGDLVTHGFTPRHDDRWPIGGRLPQPLPA